VFLEAVSRENLQGLVPPEALKEKNSLSGVNFEVAT